MSCLTREFKSKRSPQLLIAFLSALLLPSSAYANAGLPMITVNLPILVACLAPVIAIEALILHFRVSGLNVLRLLKAVAISNWITTCIGLPITWALLVVLQLAQGGNEFYYFGSKTFWEKTFTTVGFFPWLVPYSWINQYHIAVAAVVLNVVFFFASFLIERFVLQKLLPSVDKKTIFWSALVGNMASYLLIIAVTIYVFTLPHQDRFSLHDFFKGITGVVGICAWIFFASIGFPMILRQKKKGNPRAYPTNLASVI